MEKFLKIAGFLIAGLGLLFLIDGSGRRVDEVVSGIILTLIGAGIVGFFQFKGDFSKKRARKELMELKSLLDNGVLSEAEYEEKSKALKNKI